MPGFRTRPEEPETNAELATMDPEESPTSQICTTPGAAAELLRDELEPPSPQQVQPKKHDIERESMCQCITIRE